MTRKKKNINASLIAYRKYFFISLYSTVLYLAFSLLIIRSNAKFDVPSFLLLGLLALTVVIPIFNLLYRIRNRKIELDKYKLLLIISHIPLIIGFILTILFKNYLFVMISFPITLFAIFVLIPLSR
jgi:hypothetical protein